MLHRLLTFLWATAFVSSAGFAQDAIDEQEKEILLSIDVGYNSAYRAKSWVPVEVLIVNEQDDLEGWLEVRTFDGANQLQSPVYRVAINCPRDSKKIYRVNAYLDTTSRVEAWLYERGRPAVDSPAYVQTRPIAPNDLLGLVLDDEAVNFGFLYSAVQPRGATVRFFRYGLASNQLSKLPTIGQAYEVFDVIVLGDIDPDRVPIQSRRLIRNYVERGGTLIVCTGLHTAAYRGSWVEDLLGVRLGPAENSNGLALARATLPPELQEGARADRECVVADLQPRDDGVQTLGGEKVLATLHRVGRGKVYTLAVDAESHVLQNTPGYQALWREMVHSRDAGYPLNLDALSRTVSEALPSLSGVTIRPLSSVMTYLLLYLGVGVVGNWLFWNAFKRREMAWVCLVFFSIGFTVYAMVFGRSGWAESAELQRVEVLHLRSGRVTADYHGLIGILTARTRSYSAALNREGLLVRHAASFDMNSFRMAQGLSRAASGSRPFQFIEDGPGRIENFRVGASELRLVHVEGEVPVSGGIEGSITVDADGIRGTLTNGLGLRLEEAMLLYDTNFIPLRTTATGWSIEMDQAELTQARGESMHQPDQIMYIAYGGQIDEERLRRLARLSLFADDDMQIGVEHPAYLVGWAPDFQVDPLVVEQEVESKFSLTLVVAEVDLVERGLAHRRPLSVSLAKGRMRWSRPDGSARQIFETSQTKSTPGELLVRVPDAVIDSPGEIVVTLYWKVDGSGFEVYLAPKGGSSRALHEAAAVASGQQAVIGALMHTEYRISDWERYRDADLPQTLRFRVLSAEISKESTDDREERPGRGPGRRSSAFAQSRGVYAASAAFILDEEAAAKAEDNSGEWPIWR